MFRNLLDNAVRYARHRVLISSARGWRRGAEGNMGCGSDSSNAGTAPAAD
jgi:hypothetical protein